MGRTLNNLPNEPLYHILDLIRYRYKYLGTPPSILLSGLLMRASKAEDGANPSNYLLAIESSMPETVRGESLTRILYGPRTRPGNTLGIAWWQDSVRHLDGSNVDSIFFDGINVAATDIVALMPRLCHVWIMHFMFVDLSAGTWEEVFQALREAPKLRQLDVAQCTENAMPLLRPSADVRGSEYKVCDATHNEKLILEKNRSHFHVQTREKRWSASIYFKRSTTSRHGVIP